MRLDVQQYVAHSLDVSCLGLINCVVSVDVSKACFFIAKTLQLTISTVKIAGLICAAIAEVLVLVATWRATYRARKASDSSSFHTSVSRMLLRDGELQPLLS